MKTKLFQSLFCFVLTFTTCRAAEQDINIGEDRGTYFITCIVGVPQIVNIGVMGAAGNVTWGLFNPTPIAISGCPLTDSNPYTCQGITISFPTGSVPNTSQATVSWNGLAPTSGSFTFTLIVEGQARLYQIDIRRTLDVAFVLDKSGSMSAPSEGGGGLSRWDALKVSVNNFMSKLSLPTFAKPGDRVSATFFEDGITPSSFGSSLIPLEPGAAVMLQTAMNSLVPGTGTAMGAGLNDALAKLTDPSRTRNILLFTDGAQNVAPMVNTNGCDIGGVSINTPCPVPPGSSGHRKIYTIGIGDPDPVYLSTLQKLAVNSGGKCLLTSTGGAFTAVGPSSGTTVGPLSGSANMGDMESMFMQAFLNMLRDNSPQLIRSRSGIISPGGQPLVGFPLNKNVAELVLELSLGRSFSVPELFRLIATIRISRNGQDVTELGTPRFIGSSPDTYLYVFRFNSDRAMGGKLRSEGSWDIKVLPNSPAAGLTYRLTVIADDHQLDYDCGQQVVQPSVGGTQTFTVTLSHQGLPLTNATVTAQVYRPGDDVGDLMARTPEPALREDRIDDIELRELPPGMRKFYRLKARNRSFVNALRPTEQVVTLRSVGNGRYEGNYTGMHVSGIYQILYRIKSDDTLRGTYDRYEMQSMYVQPAPIDFDRSVLSRETVNGRLVMKVRPVATNGRFLGPAAASTFGVDAGSARLSNVVDNLDGSYTLTFQGNVKSTASLSILNQKVFVGQLDRVKVSERIPDVKKVFRPDRPVDLIPNPNLRTTLPARPVQPVPRPRTIPR